MLKYRPNINPIKSIRLEAYQMSTMKKRIPMFLLALAMMVAMALPTFAASPPYSARVWIYNCENSMPNLNAACESQPTDHTNVTMWSNTNSDTQRWICVLLTPPKTSATSAITPIPICPKHLSRKQ